MNRFEYWSLIEDMSSEEIEKPDWQIIAKNLYSIIQQGTKMPVHIGLQYIEDYLKATRD
jgi:hypothetical protein